MPTPIQKLLRRASLGLLFVLSAAVPLLQSPMPAEAAINEQINLQSRVTDPDGNIVGDGTYNMEFKLMTVASGGDTTQGSCTTSCVWIETRTSGNRVTISRGLMSIQLGSVSSLSGVNFNQDLYLSIRVGGTGGSPTWDPEMSPRDRLGAAPTAIFAANSDQLNGQNASYYLNAGNLTGTLADARLSSNVPLKNASNDFSVDQTISSGGKDALQLSNTGTDTGLTIGGDTNLYRSSANNLKTDDTFNALALLLTGGQSKDITTPDATAATALKMQPGVSSASNLGAALIIQAGDNSTSGGLSGTGGLLTLKGGNESGNGTPDPTIGGSVLVAGGDNTGASGTRVGGAVTIDGGTGASGNGAVTVGTTNAAATTLGRSGASTTINGGNSSALTFGDVNLYRGSTNQLKTDDAFSAASYLVGSTAGSSVTCSGGQVLQNQVVNGGIVTGGSCTSGSSNAFVQSGNSFGALATLGTNDSNALAFETGGTERARIDTNGDFGIKDTDPTSSLALGGSGTANGITLGDDASNPANLYRSAADTLKTDDTLEVAGNINASGSTSKVKEQGNDLVPAGSMMQTASMTIPAGWLEADGTAVSRATYANLFAALALSTTGNRTSGSAVITSIPSTSAMQAGMPVSGTGIAAGTAILSVDSGSQITLTQNATSTGTGGNVVVAPYGVGDGSTTFNLPDFRSKTPVGTGAGQVKANFASSDITTTGTSNVIRMNGPQTEYQTATPVVFNVVSGSAPGGLSNGATYYIIRLSATTVRLASSAANAIAGTGMNITSAGSGVFTFTYTLDTMTQGEQGGEQTHTQTTSELASHAHTEQYYLFGGGVNFVNVNGGNTQGNGFTSTSATGSNTPFNQRGPFQAVRFIIKY